MCYHMYDQVIAYGRGPEGPKTEYRGVDVRNWKKLTYCLHMLAKVQEVVTHTLLGGY